MRCSASRRSLARTSIGSGRTSCDWRATMRRAAEAWRGSVGWVCIAPGRTRRLGPGSRGTRNATALRLHATPLLRGLASTQQDCVSEQRCLCVHATLLRFCAMLPAPPRNVVASASRLRATILLLHATANAPHRNALALQRQNVACVSVSYATVLRRRTTACLRASEPSRTVLSAQYTFLSDDRLLTRRTYFHHERSRAIGVSE